MANNLMFSDASTRETSETAITDDFPAPDAVPTSSVPPLLGPPKTEEGSSVIGAIGNFTNAVVGAGAMGLGGALAQSGGLISVVSLLFFAALTKHSLDLVIRLSLRYASGSNNSGVSYEDLGQMGFGRPGRMAVIFSKLLYSLGCLVAYTVVIKDNLATALISLLHVNQRAGWPGWIHHILHDPDLTTWVASAAVILPLSLLRDMTPLASLSLLSVGSVICILAIISYLYVANPEGQIRHNGGGVYQVWYEIRPGYVHCLGTFVFTFVSQHTVHLAFASLRPSLRTLATWQRVSSAALSLATAMSVSLGVVVYLSYGQRTQSDLFQIYPDWTSIRLSQLLLCLNMLSTFPLPFFTCRELLIVLGSSALVHFGATDPTPGGLPAASPPDEMASMQEPLLPADQETGIIAPPSSTGPEVPKRQLSLPYHVALTVTVWAAVTALAVAAPSLGDVLNLVGCATGTLMAFVLPGALALRLEGYSYGAVLLLGVGGVVGVVGTISSLQQLIRDISTAP